MNSICLKISLFLVITFAVPLRADWAAVEKHLSGVLKQEKISLIHGQVTAAKLAVFIESNSKKNSSLEKILPFYMLHTDAGTRFTAYSWLQDNCGATGCRYLVNAMLMTKDKKQLTACAILLSKRCQGQDVAKLIDSLVHAETVEHRVAAIQVIQMMGQTSLTGILARLLEDEERTVSVSAGKALSTLLRVRELADKVLPDGERILTRIDLFSTVAEMRTMALQSVKVPKQIQAVTDFFDKPSNGFSVKLTEEFKELPELVAKVFACGLRSGNSTLLSSSLYGMERQAHASSAVPLVELLLVTQDEWVRIRAARALRRVIRFAR